MALRARDVICDMRNLVAAGKTRDEACVAALCRFAQRVDHALLVHNERELQRAQSILFFMDEPGIMWASGPLTIELFFTPDWSAPGLPPLSGPLPRSNRWKSRST